LPAVSPIIGGSGIAMQIQRFLPLATSVSAAVPRRSALARLAAGGAAALLGHRLAGAAAAQEATPGAVGGGCVATAPPTQEGVGFAPLLVGGVVADMPAGPVEVRISRFTLEPGTPFPPGVSPHPALMFIEAGESACPGGPGRIVYNPDGSVLSEATEEGVQQVPAGTTQYIPAGVADGAGNEGSTLMSSLVIEFVPVAGGAAAGTPPA
jgi:hypothetical protein